MTTVKEKLGHIAQQIIVDKKNGSSTEFIKFSSPDFKESDWISKGKFLEIVKKLSDKPVEYQLKRTIQGNLDERKDPQSGKALRITPTEENISVAIYTQIHGKSWNYSHTHVLDKPLFDAYKLVVMNDAVVTEIEKKQKSPENFSLNLG